MPRFKKRDEIKSLIQKNEFKIITIDGPTGSGKSKLATYLAEELNTSPIHLDKYLEENDKNYFRELNYVSIKKDIEKRNKIVIEGILMLEVIKKLKIKPDLKIFCTFEGFLDEWRYYIENDIPFNSIIDERINNINVIRALEGKKRIQKLDYFHYELDKYIFDFLPFDNVDILYDYSTEIVD